MVTLKIQIRCKMVFCDFDFGVNTFTLTHGVYSELTWCLPRYRRW